MALIQDGEFTKSIYGMIKDQRFTDAVAVLAHQLQMSPSSRPALSLLGYCYFQLQDFEAAAECYAELANIFPEEDDYKLLYAQCLYNADRFQEAMTVSSQVENAQHVLKVLKLQAAIKYGEEDFQNAKILVEQCPADDPDTQINLGCLHYKDGDYDEALRKFNNALQLQGYRADLAYNMALCYYKMAQYSQAFKQIAEVVGKGIKEHPELGIGTMTEQGHEQVRSVGNTLTLHESALVEAFNLKAAIEFTLNNLDAAKEALTDMPPRSEEELDPVTLHNQALVHFEQKPAEGFSKFQFLLQQPVLIPTETFANLLLVCCRYEYYDMAADILAEHAHLTYKYLSQYEYDFLDAVITQQTSPQEAYKKFDEMAKRQTENLRKLTKQVQDYKQTGDEEAAQKALKEWDRSLEQYLPVLMSQAKIYWDRQEWTQVERVFRHSADMCNEHDTWRLNVAHTLFMQETKFKEAAGFYEPIIRKHYDNLLDVSAIVLANLCVCYIMSNQNEEAEELMRKVEKEEERISYENPEKKLFHLCIINLVIGTLYCSKGNYEFGISRVMKAMEPYPKKLGTDTWFYAKHCFLSLLENLSKHMIVVRDQVLQECNQFFDQCETFGRKVQTQIDPLAAAANVNSGRYTVAYEARYLKALLLKLLHN